MVLKPNRFIIVGIAITIGLVALFCRIWDLHRLPGIHGDEALYGYYATNFLSGDGLPHPLGLVPTTLVWYVQVLSVALLDIFFDTESFINLRIPACAINLLLMFLAYPLMVPLIGKPRALYFTLLIWTLPCLIAASRFGQPVSQSPLFVFLSIYFFIKQKLGLSIFLFLISLWIHPTNFFLLFIFTGLLLGMKWQKGGLNFSSLKNKKLLTGVFLFALMGSYFFYLASQQTGIENLVQFQEIIQRLASPNGFFDVLVSFGRFLSGASTYSNIVGPIENEKLSLFDLIFWLVSVPLVFIGLWHLYKKKIGIGLGLAGGIFASLLTIYIVSGDLVCLYRHERYLLFLAVPTCLLFAYLIDGFSKFSFEKLHLIKLSKNLGKGITYTLSLTFLIVFVDEYLVKLNAEENQIQYGYQQAFLTSSVEPKLSAFREITREVPNGKILIGAEDWITYMPLKYLARRHKRIKVVEIREALITEILQTKTRRSSFIENFGKKEKIPTFIVGCPRGLFTKYLNEFSLPYAKMWKESIKNKHGNPILYIWRIH